MKFAILQLWEESNKDNTVVSSGATLHTNLLNRNIYIDNVYLIRDENNIPEYYDKAIGEPVEVMLPDNLYNSIMNNYMKLQQNELNNLIELEEIIVL